MLKPKITTDNHNEFNQIIKLGKRRVKYFAQEMSRVAGKAIKNTANTTVFVSLLIVVGCVLLCCVTRLCPNNLARSLKLHGAALQLKLQICSF